MASISQRRRRLHMGAEVVAITMVAPVTCYIAATNKGLPRWQRVFMYATAAGTVALDGYLLVKWFQEETK